MIVRVWSCKLKKDAEKSFEKFAVEDAIPLLRRQKGCVNAVFGIDYETQPARAVVVTVWRDLDSSKGFIGENWKEPYIHPNEADLLAEKPQVMHYMVVDRF